MRTCRCNPTLLRRFWRLVAALAAGLVVLLSVAVVSPTLHGWLHEPEHDSAASARCSHSTESGIPEHEPHPAAPGSEEDHGCAISLYSQGILSLGGTLLTQPCEGILRAVHHRAFERLALAHPRYLHLPPQAPPAV